MLRIDFFKRKKIFVKNNIEPNSNMYWTVIFYSSFLLIIASFIFGFYLFATVNKEEILPSPMENKELEKISKQRIDKVLELFAEKQEATDRILNSSASSIDPSL